MRKLYITCGLPGAGKTAHFNTTYGSDPTNYKRLGIDLYMLDINGNFVYDANLLDYAFGQMIKNAVINMQADFPCIYLDYSNIEIPQLNRFFYLGEAFNYDSVILKFNTNKDIAYENCNYIFDLDLYKSLVDKYATLVIPNNWLIETVET